ncbi:hypothetical protein [Nocardioides sediminis]|uniref:hypothetical protein n=1 Tax=Nocardioides sediminis TaxID=433648 RepID=UPI000D309C72|nr:hypothetical protein [Nocardioides sediminis]
MSDDVIPENGSAARERGAPSPTVAWLPGTVLLFIGLGMVTEGGLDVGWAFVAVGLSMTLLGCVAQGVAWGMDIHEERHP